MLVKKHFGIFHNLWRVQYSFSLVVLVSVLKNKFYFSILVFIISPIKPQCQITLIFSDFKQHFIFLPSLQSVSCWWNDCFSIHICCSVVCLICWPQHSWKGFPSASSPFPNLKRLAGECIPPGEMTGGM